MNQFEQYKSCAAWSSAPWVYRAIRGDNTSTWAGYRDAVTRSIYSYEYTALLTAFQQLKKGDMAHSEIN